jgi:hypothetical protein
MIRRLNYTGKLRIRRNDVRVSLKETDGVISFDADLSGLAEYELPSDASVFVEAYRQTAWMRFPFGRVDAINPPADRTLSEFDTPEGILFRVKVTPNGEIHKLIAEADRIPLVKTEQDDANKTPLLPVKPQKLGDEVFRVDFSGTKPLLLINSELGDWRSIAKSPAFAAFAYPAILREILVRVLVVDEHDDDANLDDWRSQWVCFSKLFCGLGDLSAPEAIDDRFYWIDSAIAAFAKRKQTKEQFMNFWKGGSEQ